MKKFIIVVTCLFIFTGCSDDNNEIINSSMPDNTIITQKNVLKNGLNQIYSYNSNKQLYTSVYYADDTQAGSVNFSITNGSSILPPAQTIYEKYIIPYTDREKLNQHFIEFNKYIKDNNIQPIKPKQNINYKKVPDNIQKGTKWNNIYLLNDNDYDLINATCIAVSQKAYFFLQDNLPPLSPQQINEISTSFDKDYNTVHKYFGKENDIDNNGKIIFLIARLYSDNIMGFFYPADKYEDTSIGSYHSNEADILYVNSYYFQPEIWKSDKINVLATFIHEFQHMTFFDTRDNNNLDTEDARWLNEGLSMLAEYYGGYGSVHKNYLIEYFDKNQGITLTNENMNLDYGYSYLFTRYLVERFGTDVINKIYLSKYTGKKALEDACKIEFNLLFSDFVKMVLYTGRNITTDKRYNVEAFNFPSGTDGYKQNGFNLSEVIDTVFSKNIDNNKFVTDTGYTSKLSSYSFMLTKWKAAVNRLNLQSDNKLIQGFYHEW